MAKVKTKKHDTFIDMTAMSDVTVLLLTFFMLTATFLPKEPVQVNTPGSVVDIKIPESNLMTILVSPQGKVYLNFDRPQDKLAIINKVSEDFKMNLSDKQKNAFINQASIGVSFAELPAFLNEDVRKQDEILNASKYSVHKYKCSHNIAYRIRHSEKVFFGDKKRHTQIHEHHYNTPH